MIIGSELGIGYDPDQHAAYAASWMQILENQPLEMFRAAADGEKIHTYLQTLQEQQSVSREELQVDKSEFGKIILPDFCGAILRLLVTPIAAGMQMPRV
jgi:antirestriction protein ArdC